MLLAPSSGSATEMSPPAKRSSNEASFWSKRKRQPALSSQRRPSAPRYKPSLPRFHPGAAASYRLAPPRHVPPTFGRRRPKIAARIVLRGTRTAVMHVQILERVWGLTARYVANAPHSWAMLMKSQDGREPANRLEC